MSGASAGAAGRPSPFVLAWLDAALAAAALGPALDLACGRGRHALALAARGARTLALDRHAAGLAALAAEARVRGLPLACLRADLEGGSALARLDAAALEARAGTPGARGGPSDGGVGRPASPR